MKTRLSEYDINKLRSAARDLTDILYDIPEGNFEISALSFFSLAILSSSNFIFFTNSSPCPKMPFKILKDTITISVIIIRPINCLRDWDKSLNLLI